MSFVAILSATASLCRATILRLLTTKRTQIDINANREDFDTREFVLLERSVPQFKQLSMQADESLVAYIATTYYDITPILGSIKPLCGYSDKNFTLTDASNHKTYVLKIVNKDESFEELTDILDEILDSAQEFCYKNAPLSSTLPHEQQPQASFIVPKLIRTTGNKLSTYTTVRYKQQIDKNTMSPTNGTRGQSMGESFNANESDATEMGSDSSMYSVKCNIKLSEYFDGITMFEYINADAKSYATKHERLPQEKLYKLIGRVCNELFVFLRTQRHLIDKLKQVRGDSFPWMMKTCEPHLRKLLDRLYPNNKQQQLQQQQPIYSTCKRALVEQTLNEYKKLIEPQLNMLPEYILHSDLCNRNILLNWKNDSQLKGKLCLIDFQDLQVGQQVIDLAIVMLYNVIEQEQIPFDKALLWIPHWIYSGYQSDGATKCPLEPSELAFVPTLMKLRLCQSLLNGQAAHEMDASNTYVMHTNQRGWQLLELMSTRNSDCGNAKKLTSFWLNGPH